MTSAVGKVEKALVLHAFAPPYVRTWASCSPEPKQELGAMSGIYRIDANTR